MKTYGDQWGYWIEGALVVVVAAAAVVAAVDRVQVLDCAVLLTEHLD